MSLYWEGPGEGVGGGRLGTDVTLVKQEWLALSPVAERPGGAESLASILVPLSYLGRRANSTASDCRLFCPFCNKTHVRAVDAVFLTALLHLWAPWSPVAV